jgi:hypothetical protein
MAYSSPSRMPAIPWSLQNTLPLLLSRPLLSLLPLLLLVSAVDAQQFLVLNASVPADSLPPLFASPEALLAGLSGSSPVTVRVAPGTYLFSNLLLQVAANISFFASELNTRFVAGNDSEWMLRAGEPGSSVAFYGIAFQQASQRTTSQIVCIEAANVSVVFSGCVFTQSEPLNGGFIILYQPTIEGSFVVFEKCTFSNLSSSESAAAFFGADTYVSCGAFRQTFIFQECLFENIVTDRLLNFQMSFGCEGYGSSVTIKDSLFRNFSRRWVGSSILMNISKKTIEFDTKNKENDSYYNNLNLIRHF